MKTGAMAGWMMVLAAACGSAAGAVLVRDGAPQAVIVRSTEATKLELQAVAELGD